MSWIYYNSDDDKYRYALGEVEKNPKRLLFCFGINPSKATPQSLDPTAKRIQKIAKEHGYDSWIILNLCSHRATLPDEMEEKQNSISQKENLSVIEKLLKTYRNCSDVLFAYGNLISKRNYLEKNLCQILSIVKSIEYSGGFYSLGQTRAKNPRHPLYQKANTKFVPYNIDGHTYSEFVLLEENRCVIKEYSEKGDLISEIFGTCNAK